MESEMQKHFEFNASNDTIEQLKKIFQEQTRINTYNVIKEFVNTKMMEGSSVSNHLFKMMGYVQELEKLEIHVLYIIVTDLILNSLPPVTRDSWVNNTC